MNPPLSHPVSRHDIAVFSLFAFLFLLQILPRIHGDSPVMDEEWDITNAVYYWHDADTTIKDGPVPLTGSLLGLPAHFLNLTYGPLPKDTPVEARAYFFLYYLNRDQMDWILATGRMVSLLCGIAIGWMIFRQAASRSPVFLISALLLWAFDPMVVGYSGVAKNDILATALAMMAWSWHQRTREEGRPSWGMGGVGILCGMAFLAKPTAFFLLPTVAVLEMIDAFGTSRRGWGYLFKRAVPFVLGTAFWIFLAYLPTSLSPMDPGSPFKLFMNYLGWIRRHGEIGVAPFFLGRIHAGDAFLSLPFSILFKWTFPFLFLSLLALALWVLRRSPCPASLAVPLVAMALLILPGLSSKISRHLLPVYPYIILMAAGAAEWIYERIRDDRVWVRKALGVLLLLWHPGSAIWNFPHALSYMNEMVPRHAKSFFLNGYNWDLNQDVKRLAIVAGKRGCGPVRLANSCRVDPYFFGLNWEPWTREDLAAPQPGTVYVLNASLMQAPDSYLKEFAEVKKSWVISTPPTGWVADTWKYYEIPGEPRPRSSPMVNSFPYFRYDLIPYRMSSPTTAPGQP